MDVSGIIGEVLQRAGRAKFPVICNISSRHAHLAEEDIEKLFGTGYRLSKLRDLMQPGEYASSDTVEVSGPKGTLPRVRVLGPPRSSSQVEVSRTDAFTLGLNPPLRNSGDIKGSPGGRIKGPRGSVDMQEGIIVARRHIHMTPEDAHKFKVSDMQVVRVRTRPPRSVVFEDVLVRVSPGYALECHLDTDEANACDLVNGSEVFLS